MEFIHWYPAIEQAKMRDEWLSNHKKGEGWFPLFRFYGAQQAFFDKSWVIGDLEKL